MSRLPSCAQVTGIFGQPSKFLCPCYQEEREESTVEMACYNPSLYGTHAWALLHLHRTHTQRALMQLLHRKVRLHRVVKMMSLLRGSHDDINNYVHYSWETRIWTMAKLSQSVIQEVCLNHWSSIGGLIQGGLIYKSQGQELEAVSELLA